MAFVSEKGVDLFGSKLPELDQLYQLFDEVNASEANQMKFAEDAEKAAADGNNIAAGIAFAILSKNLQSVENLEKAKESKEKNLYLAWSYRKLSRFDEALKCLDKAGGDEMYVTTEKISILRDAKRYDEAQKILDGLKNLEKVSADFHYQRGRLLAAQGLYEQAMEDYDTAVELDPNHHRALFHLAYACDLWGNEEEAMDYYKQLVSTKPVYVGALLNLAVLYEDCGEYEKAMMCVDKVLASHPNNARAILFKKDIESSENMYYDEEKERRVGRHNQVLEIPISDFELSVRSRNCLRKMNIRTLGDLARITESELLSYKNFGETSLKEIKIIMEMKGLRLGSALEDKKIDEEPIDLGEDIDSELLAKTVGEMELSVRARKALDRLGVRLIGELVRKTEAELLGCKNFGVTSLNEIKISLGSLGLSLRKLD